MRQKPGPQILLGGFLLAFLAGYTNGVSLISFAGESVSYVTGSLASMTRHSVDGDFSGAIHLFWIVFSFFLGATISGMVTGGTRLYIGRRYGLLLIGEGLLIALSIPILTGGQIPGEEMVSFACGLQNAMVTSISGAVVRTTHMTGVVTDLGITFGHILRGEGKKRLPVLILHGSLVTGFLLGNVGGILSFPEYRFHSLFFPAGMALLMGLFLYGMRRLFPDRLNSWFRLES